MCYSVDIFRFCEKVALTENIGGNSLSLGIEMPRQLARREAAPFCPRSGHFPRNAGESTLTEGAFVLFQYFSYPNRNILFRYYSLFNRKHLGGGGFQRRRGLAASNEHLPPLDVVEDVILAGGV